MHVHSLSDYVAEIYQAMVTTSRQDLGQVDNDLKEIVPGAMHTMLENKTKKEVIKKHQERKQKETVLPTPPAPCSGDEDLRQ